MPTMILPFVMGYVVAGILFGIFFAIKGAAVLDPAAKGAPIGFRILVIPAAAALWPLLLVKLLRRKGATA